MKRDSDWEENHSLTAGLAPDVALKAGPAPGAEPPYTSKPGTDLTEAPCVGRVD